MYSCILRDVHRRINEGVMCGSCMALSLCQVSFEGDIPALEYEPNLDDILNDVRGRCAAQ